VTLAVLPAAAAAMFEANWAVVRRPDPPVHWKFGGVLDPLLPGVPVPAPSLVEAFAAPLICMAPVLEVANTSEFAPVPGVMAVMITVLAAPADALTVGSGPTQVLKQEVPLIAFKRFVASVARFPATR